MSCCPRPCPPPVHSPSWCWLSRASSTSSRSWRDQSSSTVPHWPVTGSDTNRSTSSSGPLIWLHLPVIALLVGGASHAGPTAVRTHADRLHNWLGLGASQTASSQVGKAVRLRSVVRMGSLTTRRSLADTGQPAREFHIAKGVAMGQTRKLYRSRTNRKLAGVCGGLAEYSNIDATLIRVLFVVLTVLGGAGPLIYLAMWIIVPRSRKARPASTARSGPVSTGHRLGNRWLTA